MRSWKTTWAGSAIAAVSYAFGVPILFQYCNVIFLIGAAWLPLGIHAVDRWLRLGQRLGLLELAIVLSMQMLGGDPQAAYLVGLSGFGYALGLAWVRASSAKKRSAEARSSRSRRLVWVPLALCSLVAWCIVTLALRSGCPR